jgi:hypothetical protein
MLAPLWAQVCVALLALHISLVRASTIFLKCYESGAQTVSISVKVKLEDAKANFYSL